MYFPFVLFSFFFFPLSVVLQDTCSRGDIASAVSARSQAIAQSSWGKSGRLRSESVPKISAGIIQKFRFDVAKMSFWKHEMSKNGTPGCTGSCEIGTPGCTLSKDLEGPRQSIGFYGRIKAPACVPEKSARTRSFSMCRKIGFQRVEN